MKDGQKYQGSKVPKCQLNVTMNSIVVIAPYKYLDMWVFDDERVGLAQEPFVGGADTLIDRAVANIPDAENGFRLIFSSSEFPGVELRLTWRRPEFSGNVYYCQNFDAEAWLCPALMKYFDAPPAELFVRCEGLKPGSVGS